MPRDRVLNFKKIDEALDLTLATCAMSFHRRIGPQDLLKCRFRVIHRHDEYLYGHKLNKKGIENCWVVDSSIILGIKKWRGAHGRSKNPTPSADDAEPVFLIPVGLPCFKRGRQQTKKTIATLHY